MRVCVYALRLLMMLLLMMMMIIMLAFCFALQNYVIICIT